VALLTPLPLLADFAYRRALSNPDEASRMCIFEASGVAGRD
jgi:hypothetical protein